MPAPVKPSSVKNTKVRSIAVKLDGKKPIDAKNDQPTRDVISLPSIVNFFDHQKLRREQEEELMHYSEIRDRFYGPPPNPERAHESPATRHLPTGYIKKELDEEEVLGAR